METTTENTINYPHYYRRGGRCIKVVGPMETRTVTLPPETPAAERFTTQYPSNQRMKDAIDAMGLHSCEAFKYEEFTASFYRLVDAERAKFNEQRQERFEKGDLKL